MNVVEHHGRSASRRVAFWAGVLVIASLLAMCFAVLRVFDSSIQPELTKRSQLISTSISDDFEHAMNMGIPFDAIGGVDGFIKKRLDAFEEVDRIVVATQDGRVMAEVAREVAAPTVAERAAALGAEEGMVSVTPIFHGNSRVGEVRVITNLAFMRTKMHDVFLDVMVVALVAMLLGFELVLWVVAGSVAKPFDRVHRILHEQAFGRFEQIVPESAAGILGRIARRLTDRANDRAKTAGILRRLPAIQQAYFSDIRLPLFLFSTSTEIGGAFLPIYARNAGGPAWLSPEMAATAPLIAYLVSMAIVAPIGGKIVQRFGSRKVFLASVPITALALVGVGLGHSALSIAAWMGAMAFVYALATTACHGYVVRTKLAGQDAKAIGSYLFVIIAGAVCGSALGGVLADRIGEGPTFLVGALIALAAAGLGATAIISFPVNEEVPVEVGTTHERKGSILFNVRFLALVFGNAVPSSLGMSVFIWYIVPVVLEQSGARSADIGRVIMLYYLIPLLIGPTAARLADGRLGCVPLLVGGMGLCGVALSALAISPGFWPMVIAVAALGFGSAMCEVSRHAHAIHIAAASGDPSAMDTGFSALNLVERLAAIVGLLLSASLAKTYGYTAAIAVLGAIMLLGAALVFLAESSTFFVRRFARIRP